MKTKRCEACGKVSEGRCVDIRTEACRCNPEIALFLDNLIATQPWTDGFLRSAHPHCTLCGGIITLVYSPSGNTRYCGVCDR
jgi:hypothetical protein